MRGWEREREGGRCKGGGGEGEEGGRGEEGEKEEEEEEMMGYEVVSTS